tara:strand:+ start:1666 stop:2223 length:558 start_codon:yes stop_codon:yes gene_type:complete
MEILVGSYVKAVDENLEGVIRRIKDDWYFLECTDGFEYPFKKHQLVLINKEGNSTHFTKTYTYPASTFKEDIEFAYEPRVQLKGAIPEIDLHMEELLPNHRLKKGESALLFQLDFCRKAIQKASIARVRKMVFIHGMGSGILRDELRKMLRYEYPHIEFFDANYQRFGQGATEIIIHGLGKGLKH